MQLEEQKMFVVEGYDAPEEISVIKKDGKVYCCSFTDVDDYMRPCEDMRFFDTKDAADKYYSDMMSKFNIEKTKEYLQFLVDRDNKKLQSILPEVIYDAYKNRGGFKIFEYLDIEFIKKAFKGILNIGGVSFHPQDISKVKYGTNWLSIILKSGEEIIPQKEVEVFVIKSLFGDNYSGIIYTSIKKPGEEAD